MTGFVSSVPSREILRDAAERILAKTKRSYGSPSVVVRTRESEFGHLDLKVYRRFKEALEGRGYRFLSDIKIVGITDSPGSPLVPTMIRSMISADGAISAGHYQATPRTGRRVTAVLAALLTLRFITQPRSFLQSLMTKHCDDFESELAGTYVVTSNAEGAQTIGLPKAVDSKFFPYGTPLDEVRASHEARLKAAIKRTGATPTIMTTIDDVFAMGARLKECKNAYRAASNWVTQSELRAAAHGDTALADAIFKEIQVLLAEERNASGPQLSRPA
jgi:hypothetical protein